MGGPAEAASTFASSGAGVAAGIGGGLLSSLAGAGLSYGLNAAAASKSWDRQKNLMTRGPSYIAEGLEAAGINRILAAGSIGTSFGKAAQAAGTSVQSPDISKSGMIGAQLGALKANTAAALATAANQTANANITTAGQAEAESTAAFWRTEEGRRTIRNRHMKEGVPDTLTQGAFRGLYSGYQTWKDATNSVMERARKHHRETQYRKEHGLQRAPGRKPAIIGGSYDH